MKKSIKKLLDAYEYAANIPLEGLEISGKPALTGIASEEIGQYVILTVRDPLCAYDDDPAAQIAAHLEDGRLVARTGMFTTYSGNYKGALISIVSGGSGSPEAELILNEFITHCRADTYLRVGGSAGLGDTVRPGDLVITSGAVRDEGMTREYISPTYPAVASFELVTALVQAATNLGVHFHVGITRSCDSDYVGTGRPSVGGYMQPKHTRLVDYYNRAGVLNNDRETAAVITLASLFGLRGGSICSVADNIVTGEPFQAGAGHANAINVALEGLSVLHRWDLAKQNTKARYWVPSLNSGGA